MEPLTTTLARIREHGPCRNGYALLLRALGKTEADDEPVRLSFVARSNDLWDAVWCLRAADGGAEIAARFALAVAEAVEHLAPPAARKCNATTRAFLTGTATGAELRRADAAYAAYAAYAAAADAAAAKMLAFLIALVEGDEAAKMPPLARPT